MAFPKRYQASKVPPPVQQRRESGDRPATVGSDRLIIGLLISAAFFASYAYAVSVHEQRVASSAASQDTVVGTASAAPASAANLDPQAKLENGVQTVYVDAANGFNPQTIFAKPGTPVKIRFGEGRGCYSAVQFPQFNIYKDLTHGGAEVDLPALQPGQYQYSCGMQMAFGLLVVR